MAPSATETCQEYNTLNLSISNDSVRAVGSKISTQDGSVKSEGLVATTLNDRVGRIDGETCEADEENAFFVADLGEVYRQHLRWKKNLKRVKPHYGKKKKFQGSEKRC